MTEPDTGALSPFYAYLNCRFNTRIEQHFVREQYFIIPRPNLVIIVPSIPNCIKEDST